jgi:hypothetical protein
MPCSVDYWRALLLLLPEPDSFADSDTFSKPPLFAYETAMAGIARLGALE